MRPCMCLWMHLCVFVPSECDLSERQVVCITLGFKWATPSKAETNSSPCTVTVVHGSRVRRLTGVKSDFNFDVRLNAL
jgi:hypothetical protein